LKTLSIRFDDFPSVPREDIPHEYRDGEKRFYFRSAKRQNSLDLYKQLESILRQLFTQEAFGLANIIFFISKPQEPSLIAPAVKPPPAGFPQLFC
jgi:hypothetical protein